MTPDEALDAVCEDWTDEYTLREVRTVLRAELERLRQIEKRALNLLIINEPMTSRAARVILGERP